VEVTVNDLRKPAIVYKIAPSGNSELAGCKIVGVASVGDKNAFTGICTLSEYFPSSVYNAFNLCRFNFQLLIVVCLIV